MVQKRGKKIFAEGDFGRKVYLNKLGAVDPREVQADEGADIAGWIC